MIKPLTALEIIPAGEAISVLAWSPSGGTLAIGTHGDQITVAELSAGLKRHLLEAPSLGTHALAWLGEDSLWAGGAHPEARRWQWAEAKSTPLPLESNRAWVEHLEPSPDRKLVAAAAGPHLWLLDAKGEKVRQYPKLPSTIADVVWHPSGKNFAAVGNGFVHLFRAGGERAVDELAYGSSMLVGAYHPRGQYFAVGCQDCTVHFWRMTTGDDSQMAGYPRKIRELAWHPRGRWLAVGGSPEVTLWDFSGSGPEGTTPRTLAAHQDFVQALAYSPDGRWLVSVADDGFVIVWPSEGIDRPVAAFRTNNPVTQVAWRPDSQAFAVGGEAGEVVLLAAPDDSK